MPLLCKKYKRFLNIDFLPCKNSLLGCNSYFIGSLGFSLSTIMLSVNQNRSTYSFLVLKTFIAFSYFMAPARTSIQLNGERGQTCFILILGGTPFFTIEYDICPFWMPSIRLQKFPSISILPRVFNHKWVLHFFQLWGIVYKFKNVHKIYNIIAYTL